MSARKAGGRAGAPRIRAEPERRPDERAADLAAERARLEAIVRQIPVGLILAEAPSGRILLGNREAERLLGIPVTRAPSMDLYVDWVGFHPDGQPVRPEESPLTRALGGEEVRGEEYQLRRGDGSLAWVRVSAAPYRDGEGRVVAGLAVLVDIAAEKRAEEGQRFLAEASAILASSLDIEGTLNQLASLAVQRIADHCIIDILSEDGRQVRRVALVSRDPGEQALLERMRQFPPDTSRGTIARSIDEGRSVLVPEVTESWLRSVADSDAHFDLMRELAPRSAMIVPMVARGETFGAITLALVGTDRRYGPDDLELAEDLAHRVALSIENSRLYRATLAASEAKSDFLAVVSHELRTPLTAIIGYTDLIRADLAGPVPERIDEYIGRIESNSRRLLRLVEEVLAFGRSEAGRAEVELEPVDLRDLAGSAAAIARPLAAEKGLELHVDVPAEAVATVTDRGKVVHILVNLLDNAVKFTERGRVELRARAEDGSMVFEVKDTGIGIPPEYLEQIFEPFQQVEEALTREKGGPASGSPPPGATRACWAATSRSRARPAWAARSPCGCRFARRGREGPNDRGDPFAQASSAHSAPEGEIARRPRHAGPHLRQPRGPVPGGRDRASSPTGFVVARHHLSARG